MSSTSTSSDPFQAPPVGDASSDETEGVEYVTLDAMAGGAVPERYRIAHLLDEGGMGKIHVAKDLNLRRRVVIKDLKPGQSSDAVADFIREVQITAQLDHPNIVPIYNVIDPEAAGGSFAFTMKLIEGRTLETIVEDAQDRLREDPRAGRAYERREGIRSRLEMFTKVCLAIQYAHTRDVLHRDLKPANIMVGAYGEVYVMDWGFAYSPRIGATEPPATLAGTPKYMAPEQFKGDATILGPESDVFALGLILFELITLKRATVGEGVRELIENTPAGRFNSFIHIDEEIPLHPDLAAIVQRALQIDRRLRYSSTQELLDDLERYLRDEEVSVRPDTRFRKIARWIGHHRTGALVTLLIVTLVASIATIWGFASAYAAAQQRKAVAEQGKRVAEQDARLAEQDKQIAEQKKAQAEAKAQQAELDRQREAQISRFMSQISQRARSIDQQFAHAEDLVRGLADTTRLLLDLKGKKARIYEHTDYDKKRKAPKDLAPSSIYNKAVSLDHAVVKLAPGVKKRKVKKQLRSLAPLRAYFLRMLLHTGDLANRERTPLATASLRENEAAIRARVLEEGVPARWVFVGLETGVMYAYPGKSGYDDDYDPRLRPWYALGKEADDARWGKLYEDAQGQGLLLPCVAPVRDEDDALLGVVALEITLDDIIRHYIQRDAGEGFVEAFLLDAEGRIVVRTGGERDAEAPEDAAISFIEGAPYHIPDLALAVAEQPSGILHHTAGEGRELLVGYQHLDALGWTYVEEVEASSVLTGE